MRKPNGYGGVVKLSGNRRKPYVARITANWETYVDDNGNVKTRQKYLSIGSYPTRREAEIALALYNNDPYDLVLQSITFSEAYEGILQGRQLAASSLRRYASCFKKAERLHNKPLIKINKRDMQLVIDSIDSPYMQRACLYLFTGIFNWARDEAKIIKNNPCDSLTITAETKAPREGIPYSVDEIKTLWRNLHKIPNVDTLLIQIYSGTRIMEMLSIKKEDVHLDENWMMINGTKNKNAVRQVPIRGEIKPLLAARINDSNNKSDYVIVGKQGKSIKNDRHYINIAFDPICKALGMTHHVTHDARHTFVSRADESNMNLNALKKTIGHALDGVTGKAYTHKNIENLIAEVNKIKFI